MGLLIIKGSMEEDEKGKFTYVRGGGTSVIDYVLLTNKEGRDWVTKMVVEETLESDHMLIQI